MNKKPPLPVAWHLVLGVFFIGFFIAFPIWGYLQNCRSDWMPLYVKILQPIAHGWGFGVLFMHFIGRGLSETYSFDFKDAPRSPSRKPCSARPHVREVQGE